MEDDSPEYQKPISRLVYVIAGASFIPLIGVPFGVAAIVWGLVQRAAGGGKAAAIGLCGIGFTVAIYSGLFYFGFVQRGGVYDELRAEMATRNLVALVSEIELHRVQTGAYPTSLEDLPTPPSNPFASIYDPTSLTVRGEASLFHYELLEGSDRYRLLSVGADGLPNTADDVYPKVDRPEGSTLGLAEPVSH